MVIPAIPDHDHLASKMLQQIAEERDDLVRRVETITLGGEVKPQSLTRRRDTDARDDRHLVAVTAIGIDHRRLPDLGPGPLHQRIEKQAGFVDQDEVSFGVGRFF